MKGFMLTVICIAGFFFIFGDRPTFSGDLPSRVKKRVNEAITIRQHTQKAEDRWAEQRTRLRAEYEKLEQENNLLSAENRELRKSVAKHKESIAALEHQIVEIERMTKEMYPFLEQTYTRLARFVREDIPFLKDERSRRITNLRRVLDDPGVSISEKFRKLMEAIFIEAEYGNTVEVYQKRIRIDDRNIQANIFRLGRISMFFQSLDRKTTGYFDPATFAWKRFPSRFNREINAAVEMAAKRRPIDILNLPLGRLEVK